MAPSSPSSSSSASSSSPSSSSSASSSSASSSSPSSSTSSSHAPTPPPGAFPPASTASVLTPSSSPSSSVPSSSADTTPPASNPFAERFLPPPVDPSHVISSAAPSSLPIELPAIRADHSSDESLPLSTPHPSSSSSSVAAATAATTTTTTTTTAISPSSASATNHAANLGALSILQRWTLRASESQFNALAGAVGGFTAGVATCPLDVIKTKLQAQGGFAALQRQQQAAAAATGSSASTPTSAIPAGQHPHQHQHHHHRVYNGLLGTGRVILRDEGIRGLYRGLGPIVMGYLPTWAVWFTVYNKSKIWLSERAHLQNTFAINFWSSVMAGGSSTIVTNPIWVIKTRLMSQMPHSAGVGASASQQAALATPWHYHSTLDAARKMYTTEGILSFYSGLTPALLGLTHVAVQFPAYEYLKTKFTGVGMGGVGVGGSGSSSDGSDGDAEAPTHWLGVLSATILSKVLASSLTYPHEVIRTRLQTQRRRAAKAAAATTTTSSSSSSAEVTPRYKGVVTTFRTILREEGWRAFYAGMGTNMMRAVPAATVTMLTYEYMMRELKRTRHEARQRLEPL